MADHAHGDYKHGSMDIRVQEKTFAGFIHMVSWALVVTFVVLVFLALAGA
ncbi:MAG: aa3-type cytochrome c oxidase subunit IV [Paracoccaceae bacterium]